MALADFRNRPARKGGDKQIRPGRSGQRDNPAGDDHADIADGVIA